mmetsp:Transcript_4307/g.12809  ORF Transcript_4307/g.12809 Transcript_4307/m.12809 type:complete len:534 (-) Transcript_4307:30-1631(-)
MRGSTRGSRGKERQGRWPASVSFSACGWLKLYCFGVAKAFVEHGLQEHCQVLLGASAGSLVAVGVALGLDFDEIAAYALECVTATHGRLLPAFQLRHYIAECVDKKFQSIIDHADDPVESPSPAACPEPGVGSGATPGPVEVASDGTGQPAALHERLRGKIAVSVTTLPRLRNRRYMAFESDEHLKQVLLASCTMSPLAGWPFLLDGHFVFDGGLTDFQPVLDSGTVTVSPFYCSSADIRPSRYVPIHWALYPPQRDDFEWVYHLGYDDACSWLQRNVPGCVKLSGNHCSLPSGLTRPDLHRFPSDEEWHMRHADQCETDTDGDPTPVVTPVAALHPTHSYIQAWPYGGGGRAGSDCTEHSFQRVFGYRSILKVIPCWMLDFILMLVVFAAIRPVAFFLVYCELAGIALVIFCRDVAPAPLRVTWGILRDTLSLAGMNFQPFHASSGGARAHSSIMGQGRIQHRRRLPHLHAVRRKLRAAWRRLAKVVTILCSPTLLLRMVPIVGKAATGKAYSLRRRLCEHSAVYRVCVHFL